MGGTEWKAAQRTSRTHRWSYTSALGQRRPLSDLFYRNRRNDPVALLGLVNCRAMAEPDLSAHVRRYRGSGVRAGDTTLDGRVSARSLAGTRFNRGAGSVSLRARVADRRWRRGENVPGLSAAVQRP